MQRNRKGFTLVELLVVIAIIGLLATIAFLSLNRARSKARDAKRVSDVRQLQSAMELYYNDQTTPGYPIQDAGVLTSASLPVAYMATLPKNPTPDDDPAAGDTTACTTAAYADTVYHYRSLDKQGGDACSTAGAGCGSWYQMSFCLGGATGGVAAGCNLADPAGMTSGTCF